MAAGESSDNMRSAAAEAAQARIRGRPAAAPGDPPRDARAAEREDEDLGLSFEELVEKYHKKIFDLILRTINDTEEALDLTQETFVNAYRSFGSFRGECKIHTWLCQIALNQCKNRFRQRDRRRSVEGPSLDQQLGGTEDPTRTLEIPDWEQSPQEVLIRNETYRYVLKAIASLPDEYRTVIVLCDLQ